MSQYAQYSVSKVFGMPSIPEKVLAVGYADTTNPFIPATDPNYVFRKEFVREVLAFLKEPGGDALYASELACTANDCPWADGAVRSDRTPRFGCSKTR